MARLTDSNRFGGDYLTKVTLGQEARPGKAPSVRPAATLAVVPVLAAAGATPDTTAAAIAADDGYVAEQPATVVARARVMPMT